MDLYRVWLFLMLFWFYYIMKGIQNKNLSKVVFVLTIPFAAFLLFTHVFVLNNGSNITELSSSHHLWVMWHHGWFVLFFGNLVCFVASFITLFSKPYPVEDWKIFVFRFVAFSTVCITFYYILGFVPDA